MSSLLVKELFRAIDSCAWKALPNLFDADIVYERPSYTPTIKIDQLLYFYKEIRAVASGKHYIDQIVVDGDCGACWGRFLGLKKDGSKVDELFADVYRFKNGKIQMRRSYFFRPAI